MIGGTNNSLGRWGEREEERKEEKEGKINEGGKGWCRGYMLSRGFPVSNEINGTNTNGIFVRN